MWEAIGFMIDDCYDNFRGRVERTSRFAARVEQQVLLPQLKMSLQAATRYDSL